MANSTLSVVDRLEQTVLDQLGAQQNRDPQLSSNLLLPESLSLVPLTSVSAATTPEPSIARDDIRIPRITIHAFYQGLDLAQVFETAARDRLMSGARFASHSGGVAAAIELYSGAPTPNLIVLECQSASNTFLADLDALARVCDAGTRLMVIGLVNDVGFYRELVKRGVSEYQLAPIQPVSLVSAISNIYKDGASNKLGHTYAFVGAKGGVGSSTIAHNVAWTISRDFSSEVILADMDLPFGTAGLNMNTDASQGIAEAINDAGRLDHVLLERLLTKCGDRLGLLPAPTSLDDTYDLDIRTIQPLLSVAQSTVPFTILDMPHIWTQWARGVLETVDEVVIVATPDLASLRNLKNLVGILKRSRPHDPAPKVVLNQIGVPKRPEIKPADFARALQLDLTACISFNPQLFGAAANKGKMVAEVTHKGDAVQAFTSLSRSLVGQRKLEHHRAAVLDMNSLVNKLRRLRAK